MPRELDVKFLGPDIEKVLDDLVKSVDGNKVSQKNKVIRKGLRVSAKHVYEKLIPRMAVLTGALRNLTAVKSMRGVGYKISTPTREKLAMDHPEVASAKGYYPAAIEYGFKTRSGSQVEGDATIRNTMEENQRGAMDAARAFYKNFIFKDAGRQLKRKTDLTNKRR